MFVCPQCGNDTEILHEGYCQWCCARNQMELDTHNLEYDHWRRMSAKEQEAAIKEAIKNYARS